MSAEFIAIITVGIGLAVLVSGLFAWLRADMVRMESRLNTRMDERIGSSEARMDERIGSLEARMDERIGNSEARMDERFSRMDERFSRIEGQIQILRDDVAELRTEVVQLRERIAHLDGLLQGLREAISARVPG